MSKISIDEIVLIVVLLGSLAMSCAIFLFHSDADTGVKLFSLLILWTANGLCAAIYHEERPLRLLVRAQKALKKEKTREKVPAE